MLIVLLTSLTLIPLSLTVDFNWCVESFPGLRKCEDLQHHYQSAGSLDFSCSHNLAEGGCLRDVITESRTIASANPGELYHRQRTGGKYKVILAEDYDSSASRTYYRYYSVAVVKVDRPDLKLLDLKDKKVCHSRYDDRGASGWDIPISYLYTYHRKFKLDDRCNVLNAVNNYFGPSCLPDPDGIIRDDMRLCHVCSSRTCSKELRYRGYKGAFRCLVEDAGEVAFLTHTTVSEWTDGKSSEPWAAGLKSKDYRLLCPDGSQVEVQNYAQCFIGWMKPDAVVISQNVSSGLTTRIQNNLRNPPLKAAELIFDTRRYVGSGGADVIFSEETKELRILYSQEQNPREYLGADVGAPYQFSYMRAMDGLYCVTDHAHKCDAYIFSLFLLYAFIILL